MGRIRAFVQEDIPNVAELYWHFLQGQKGPYPPSLERYFHEVFFHNPWWDSSIASLVYEEGQHGVVGFLGVVPRPMSVNGKPIQAAFGSSFVVHPKNRGLAGLKLLVAFFEGKQDLAMTDTSNQLNQQIWVRLGGSTSAVHGLKWARPLRLGLYGLSMLLRFGKEGFSGSCGRACGVLHKTISAVATKIPERLRLPLGAVTEEELEIDTLLHSCLPSSFECYSLRPEYNRESLRWLLDFMSRMKASGTLRKIALRDATRQLIGWFIYYVKPGGIAEVVQIGAAKRHMKTVLDYLFSGARNRGAIAVHGSLEIRHAQELSEARCFFWGSVPLLFHARDPKLARLVQQGDAFLSRLDGEWCLRYGAPEHKSPSVGLELANGNESSPEAARRLAPGNFQPAPLQPRTVK
jgi:hypothetical protein